MSSTLTSKPKLHGSVGIKENPVTGCLFRYSHTFRFQELSESTINQCESQVTEVCNRFSIKNLVVLLLGNPTCN